MSEHDHDAEHLVSGVGLGLDELAEQQRAQVVEDLDDLKADVWASDEELDAFLADLRASRNASIG